MTGSSVRHSAAAAGGNVATPHAAVDSRVRPVTPFSRDNVNAAGGINASATDIAKWIMVQLDSGRLTDGSQLFTPRTSRELWSVVTPFRVGNPPPELAALRTNFAGYALGFGLRDYRGWKIVSHTGGLPGLVSRITLVPNKRLGIAVFTNQESGEAFEAITWRLLDHSLGAPTTDWIPVYAKLKARGDSIVRAQERAGKARRDSTSHPSLPLEKYAGIFRDAWYGDVTIALEGGRLVLRFTHTPDLTSDLEHYQYDTFIARWRNRELRADAYVTFALKPDGSIDQVKMAAVSPATDFSFDFQDLLLVPAPLGPRSPKNSPGAISRSRPSSATISPGRPSRPPPAAAGYTFRRARVWIAGSVIPASASPPPTTAHASRPSAGPLPSTTGLPIERAARTRGGRAP